MRRYGKGWWHQKDSTVGRKSQSSEKETHYKGNKEKAKQNSNDQGTHYQSGKQRQIQTRLDRYPLAETGVESQAWLQGAGTSVYIAEINYKVRMKPAARLTGC